MTYSLPGFGILRLPDSIQFGPGARSGIPVAVRTLGSRVFVVADPFLASTAEFRQTIVALDAAGVAVEVFTGVVPELPVDSVDDAAEAARVFCPDVIVGYGGGSAIDLAKLVALLLRHPGPLSDYYGENLVPGAVVPIIAVPTTAGTGSEVTPVAVVSDPGRALKVGISDAALIPRFAIVDPELTLGAPASVTAHSGADALVHAIESFTAADRAIDWRRTLPIFVGRNRLSSLLALDAITAIGPSLPIAVSTPGDISARTNMAWGSLLAGMAFGSGGTHLSHALQYPIGAMTKTPHGLGTGMMLPYVMQACLAASAPELAGVADALGVAADGEAASAQAAVDAVASIMSSIGIPSSLADIGIQRADLPRVAELTAGVTRLVGNSKLDVDQATLLTILEAAYAGDRSALRP